MMPMQYSANVNLPYYGWFGRDGFTCEQEARNYVAKMLRDARHNPRIGRPTYKSRHYVIRSYLLKAWEG